MPKLLKLLLFTLLLSVVYISATAQCGCDDCGGSIPDDGSEQFLFIVDAIDNDDLSDAGQGLCKVSLQFRHSYLGDLSIFLTSPAGQTVRLIGPSPVTPGSTPLTAWDVCFVPGDEVAVPDPAKPAVWDNDLDWQFVFGTYTGSYYPHEQDLRDFNTGSVSGIWTLTVQDRNSGNVGTIDSFALEFCDAAGIDCSSCTAEAGQLQQDTFIRCFEERNRTFEITPTFDEGLPGTESKYVFALARNDTLLYYLENVNLDSLPYVFDIDSLGAGVFEVCGLSYSIADSNALPGIDTSLLSDLRNSLTGFSAPFCGEITDSCHIYIMLPAQDTTFESHVLCPGDTFIIDDSNFIFDSGTFIYNLSNQQGCDSVWVLNIQFLDSSIAVIDTAFCAGDTLSLFGKAYTETTLDTLILQDSASNGCDSFIYLNVLKIDVNADIVAPDQLDCLTDTVRLDGSLSEPTGQAIASWETSTGNIIGNEDSLVVYVDRDGTYSLLLTASENGVVCSDTDNVVVEIDTVHPIAQAPQDTILTCSQPFVKLIGNSDNDSTVIVSWQLVGQPFNLGSDTTVSSAGTYIFQAVDTSNGCSATDTTIVTSDNSLPTATLFADTISCRDSMAQISATLSTNVDSIIWSGPQSFLSNNATDSVAIPGLYSLVFIADNGCVDSSFIMVVADTVAPDFTLAGDTINCIDTAVWLTVNAMVDMSEVTWRRPDNSTIAADSILAVEAGIYSATVFADNGCSSTQAVDLVADTLAPVIMAMGDTINCVDTMVTLTGFSNEVTDIPMWESSIGNTFETSIPGNYRFSATGLNGCVADTQVLVAIDTVHPKITLSEDRVLDCRMDTVLISAKIEGASNFHITWREIVRQRTIDNQPFISINQEATFIVIVTNEDNGCIAFSNDTLYVTENRNKPISDAGNPDTITCVTDSVVLGSTGSSTGDSVCYEWYDRFQSLISTQAFLTVGDTGLYSFTVIDTSNGCRSTDSVRVALNRELPTFTIAPPGNINCLNDSVRLLGQAQQMPGLSYRWTYESGMQVGTLANAWASRSGEYQLRITRSDNGCTDSAAVTVELDTVRPMVSVVAPDTISCENENVILSQENQAIRAVFNWVQNGQNVGNDPFYSVNAGGTYVLIATDTTNGCVDSSSVEVFENKVHPTVNAGNDTMASCFDTEISLNGQVEANPEITFSWLAIGGNILTGSQSLSPLVSAPGIYVLEGEDNTNGCVSLDTVNVEGAIPLELADAGMDVSTCNNRDSLSLSANLPPGTQGQWIVPSTVMLSNETIPNPSVDFSASPAIYELIWQLSTDDCPSYSSDTLQISIGGQQLVAIDDSYDFDANVGNIELDVTENDLIDGSFGLELLSKPAQGELIIDNDNTLSYLPPVAFCSQQIFAYQICSESCPDICDTALVTLNVSSDQSGGSYSVPNAISPNGDGLNDVLVFDILTESDCYSFDESRLVIFNRWGDVLFETDAYKNDWSGTNTDGQALPQGTYYFILNLDTTKGEVVRGDITILR